MGHRWTDHLGLCSRRKTCLCISAKDAADTQAKGGIPFSDTFSHVSPSRNFPVRATILSICFCCVYGLLYLVSTTAFNSIVTSAVLYLVRPPLSKTSNLPSEKISTYNSPSSFFPPNPEHHLRRPSGHHHLPRPRDLPSGSSLRSRHRRLHLQSSLAAACHGARNFHLPPARTACHGEQYELYPRYPVRHVFCHRVLLVYEGQEVYRSEDWLGVVGYNCL